MGDHLPLYREIIVPESCSGMRLDRFLARRFQDRSRSWLVQGIRQGQVMDDANQRLRPSHKILEGMALRLTLPGIAPSTPPPPLPSILHEDARVVVLNKPAGMLAHPAGTNFTWALVSLAKAAWSEERVDLVHRLDRDTSGVIVLTRDLDANRDLKEVVKRGGANKTYIAICKGEVPWDHQHLRGPIGAANGVIRIQMAVTEDGLRAHTEVQVLERQPGFTKVRCILHTGRTHQIRVHMAHAGFPLLGDRLYGVPPEVFLYTLDNGTDAWVREQTGAPHHALHAERIIVAHPAGGTLDVQAPVPEHLTRWWQNPSCLPHDESEP